MSPPIKPRRAPENQLLAALLDADYKHLAPHLEHVPLALGEVIYEADRPIQYVYFPENAVISMLSLMEDGSTVEVGLVGSEGMLGIRILLGARTTPHSANVQLAGTVMRMSAATLDRELRTGSPLQGLLLLYTQALLTQVRQSAACNVQHKINQRLARWLLTMQDYAKADDLHLTQDLIAMMMGSRRASVTEAATKLQRARLIRYRRGDIRIVDRQGLEEAACECYRIVKEEFDRLYRQPDLLAS